MNRTHTIARQAIEAFALFLVSFVLAGCATRPSATVESINYHGWPNSLRLATREAEVIVVPEIGRVMSFRLTDGENVLWEDCSLDGKRGESGGKEWVNFGGDKSWPAPEAEWSQHTRYKQWMPPPGFDGLPASARVASNGVVLTSAVDPFYGIRVVRHIQLRAQTLHITTGYERVSVSPLTVGVWVITQFREPEAVFVPILGTSIFTNGYFQFDNAPWPELKQRGRFIEITRSPTKAHKMGSDADRLVWVGQNSVCVVSTKRVTGASYPDRGASAEVYTNPNPKPYVELELLGPLSALEVGDHVEFEQRCSLRKRQHGRAAIDEAAAIF